MPLYALNDLAPTLPGEGRYWVAPDAHVIGDVALEEDVSFWFGAVARGDNTRIAIGARTNIQEGAMLHSDPGAPLTIGADVTVGHAAIIHACQLEDRAFVGMGATVLDKAVIREGGMLGAGGLLAPGKVIGPNELWLGSPARFVRVMTEEERAHWDKTAAHYVALSREHRTSL